MSFTILHTEWSSGWGGQEMRIVAESVAFRARGYCMLVAAQPGSQILARAAEAGLTAIPLKIHPAQAAQTAERGYAHTHVNFTFDGMIERTEAVYRGLLANATPG